MDRQPRVGGAKICRVGNCRIRGAKIGPISRAGDGPLPAWAIDQQDKFGPRFSSRGPYVFAVSQTRPNTRCLLLTASESSPDDRPCPPLNHRLIPRDESAARRSRSATLSSRTWKSARRADPAYVPRINSTATSLDDEPWIVALDAEEKKMRRNIIRGGV